ncbi:MAG: hypothetical protein ACYSVY_18995, partial [Planctomycetota bacterium]|jgi:hypothetical protein
VDELVPQYLEAIPSDPYVGRPLCYRRQDSGDYLLYSVGPNEIDDGGRKQTFNVSTRRMEPDSDWDWVYTHPRPEPWYVPELEEVKP